MHFAEPTALLLGLIVVAMTAGAVWLARWRAKARASFAGPQAQHWYVAPSWPRLLLVIIAAVLIVIAAAQPRWGHRELTRQHEGIDLVIALDVSQSMLATDTAPSRIDAASEQAAELVEAQRGSQVGLVLFGGSAVLRSPLTTDTGALAQLLRRAKRDAGLATSGSDLSAALEQAGRVLTPSETAGKAVLIISDGEDHAGGFAEAARDLQDRGIVVFAAGVGTAQGSTIPETDPRTNQTRLKVDAQGRTVVTHLEEGPLQSIALAGGGSYLRIGGSTTLLSLRDQLARLEQTPLAAETQSLPIERYQAFVVAALILLVESWLVPTRLLLPAASKLRRVRPQAGIAIVLLALFVGACGSSDPLRGENAKANRLYDAGDYQGALDAYQALLAQRPDVPELSVNAGNALHRLESYDRAVAETQRALPPIERGFGAVTFYDLGNHLLAQQQLELAYDAYKNALLLDPGDADSKYNLELTLQLLAQRQAEQQSQQQPGGAQEGEPQQQEPQAGEAPQQPGEAPQGGQQPQQASPGSADQPPTPDSGRELQDALKGIDQNLTFEEAARILDLLRQSQENQRRAGPNQRGPGPDY